MWEEPNDHLWWNEKPLIGAHDVYKCTRVASSNRSWNSEIGFNLQIIFFSLLKTDKKARLIVFIIADNSIYTDNRKRNRKNLSKFFKRCKCTKHADNWGGDGNWVFHPTMFLSAVQLPTQNTTQKLAATLKLIYISLFLLFVYIRRYS